MPGEDLSLSVCLSVSVCLACPHWSLLRFKRGRVGRCMLTYLLEGAVQTSVYIMLVLPLVFFFSILFVVYKSNATLA